MAITSHTAATRPFTWDGLEDMPDDGYRREIIGGSLIVSPAPITRHQLAVSRLVLTLGAVAPNGLEVMPSPFDWRTPDGGCVEPDVMVVDRVDLDLDGPFPSTARPRLVVEVLSPSNKAMDRLLQRDVYERLGVPAYWIVDPVEPAITALRRDGRFDVEATVTGDDAFASERPFPVTFRPADLLA